MKIGPLAKITPVFVQISYMVCVVEITHQYAWKSGYFMIKISKPQTNHRQAMESLQT